MRPLRVRWGKVTIQIPAEIVLYLLVKALMHL